MQPVPEGTPPAANGSAQARGCDVSAADDADVGDGSSVGTTGPGLKLVFAETEAHSRLAVLARLAPYRLMRHVIASGQAIDHESYFDRTCCAALFIDISGFSKMTEKLVNKNGLEGAEQLARHLNINLGRIVDRLTHCGADVIKFAGDAALCIFPAVEGGPDLAAQTLRATQLSLECISALERENYVVEGIRLTAHSGLGCGEATGFFAGGAKPPHLADARTEYTPIGAPMTQIASSEPAAGDGETVVSPECWELIGHQCIGRMVVDAKTQEKNYLVTEIKPEFKMNLDNGASGGITDELLALSATEASAVADQITVVVPEAVRAHLTDLVPGAIPNIAEFRSVTVLFSRLTGLDYSRGQSELQKVQQIVRLVQETIYKYKGQLMRFSVDDKGAVVLGVFGLPPSNQDDPERGVLAAMEYCQEISKRFDGVRATVGITTGYCFSGLVGGVSRCEYTTHGPLVNLAARLMVASERDALVDTATKDRCQTSSSIEFTPMPAIQVKGREEPVPIFVPRKVAKVRARVIARSATTLTDSSPAASPRSPRGLGGKTPRQRARQLSREAVARPVPSQKMIGRRQECELIRRVFARVEFDPDAEIPAAQPPLCVLVEGEAGIGKSELCREAMHYAQGMQMDSFWTAGHVDTVNTMLRPFRCVIRGLFYEEQKHMQKRSAGDVGPQGSSSSIVQEQHSEKYQRDRVFSQLTAIFSSPDCPEELRKRASMLYAFVTALPCESRDFDLHAPTMVKLIVYWLAERCTYHGPTLLVLDDAQWLDPTSWALCEALAASEKCRGKLVLMFALRPIQPHSELAKRTGFLRRSLSNHLELQPMTKPDLIEIVKKRLESHLAESSSHGGFGLNSSANKMTGTTPGSSSSLARAIDTNDALKLYMQHFDESCIHVGGLGDGQEEDDELEEFFGQFGTVYGATVRVREGTNRSWGVVSFASPDQAIAAINSEDPILTRITRRAVSRKQAMRSTGSLLPVYKQQVQKVQLNLQQKLLDSAAKQLKRTENLSQKDIRFLLESLGVEIGTTDLQSVMRQAGDGDGIVATLAGFHKWWAANGFEFTQAADATYRVPAEVVDAIKKHPSGNPLRMLLLASEVIAGDQTFEHTAVQSPGSPRRPRRHIASDGSWLHTDEDTGAAIGRMIQRLTPDERHILQLVAVSGADCSLRMIQTMQHELDALQSVSSKHAIDDRNIVPTFHQLMEKRFLIYPSSLSAISDSDGHVNHLLFAEKIVEEVVLASLDGAERHVLSLAAVQRCLFTPDLHREQLARDYARTENGSEDAASHLRLASLLAIEMQADSEAANLCSEIIQLPAVCEDANESIRVRWMARLAAAKLRSSRDGIEKATALLPIVKALQLCEMPVPLDAGKAAANASLLLRGGQLTIPAPKPSPKIPGPSASKLRFRRLARKATHNHAGTVKDMAESAVVKKKTEATAVFREETIHPRWIMLAELHLLLASSAQAAGMWELHNYAIVASLRLLEARGQTNAATSEAARMGALALTNVGFGSPSGITGDYSVREETANLYQSEAEAALAARVHSAIAASARQLGVPEWAQEHQQLANRALEAASAWTDARGSTSSNGDKQLPRDLREAEWETHRNLAQSHIACANLDDGLEEIIASSRYSHAAGVEESRKEEALYAASWLVFWANGPTQAHQCFCGDELAVSAERRGDNLMLARILCGQALCEMHIRVDSHREMFGRETGAGTSISECLESAEEHLNAFEAAIDDAGDVSTDGTATIVSADASTTKLRRRTASTVTFSDQPGSNASGHTAAIDFAAGGSGEIDDSREVSGAARVQRADRLGLRIFIRSLRCLNMLWETKNSPEPDDALLAILPTLQPLGTQVASDLLKMMRKYDDEEALARPEYVEGFGAVTMVLLEIAQLRLKSGQQALAQSLQLTAFHCALASEHFTRAPPSHHFPPPGLPLSSCVQFACDVFLHEGVGIVVMLGFFAGATPLAANLRASCALAQSDGATAHAAYSKAIDAVKAMKPVAAVRATGGFSGEDAGVSSAGKSMTSYVIELCRAESGIACLELQGGDCADAQKRLETVVRRLQQAGSVVLARQVEQMRAAI